MTLQALVIGGGIGGLASALAVSQAGWDVRLLEQSAAFSDVGAGIQLGPNVVRVLHRWGLARALQRVAAFPNRLLVCDATSGRTLAELPLDGAMQARYGAPYATVHRADLHALLLQAVEQGTSQIRRNRAFTGFIQTPEAVTVQTLGQPDVEADALIGADGLWSAVRSQLLGDGRPAVTGHLAYRALVRQTGLPEHLQTRDVTVWLGPRMHVVHYPVRSGEWLNVVAVVHGAVATEPDRWDHAATPDDVAAELTPALSRSCAALQERTASVPSWERWMLHDRPPLAGSHEQAAGRVALVGDAAHPMRPYLAQGAGMAIEDACELGRALAGITSAVDTAAALQRFARARWERNARVQRAALQKGQIFHATGWVRWGRDASLQLLGRRLLDMPWLYGYRS